MRALRPLRAQKPPISETSQARLDDLCRESHGVDVFGFSFGKEYCFESHLELLWCKAGVPMPLQVMSIRSIHSSLEVSEEKFSPFLLTSGFTAHVANPSYALML